jgi:hypothetical protein
MTDKKCRLLWGNVYPDGDSRSHASKWLADDAAERGRTGRICIDLDACQGRFDEVPEGSK